MPLLQQPGITLLGLGPGDPDLLTRKAWNLINNLSEIYLRTERHPVVQAFPKNLKILSFDDLYESQDKFEDVYNQIVQQVLLLGKRPQGVVYAVPGHPFIAEATSPEIYLKAQSMGIPVNIIDGLSFLEPTFTALGLDPFPRTVMVDAFELSRSHHPPFPPDLPVLVAQIHSQSMASDVKLTLMEIYPDEHKVCLLHAAGTSTQVVENLSLYEIDRSKSIGLLSSLYVPALGPQTSFEALMEIVSHLRAPDGCPWDKEQTSESLRQHLLEEAFEALEAIDSKNPDEMREEFGDLLLMIAMQSQIANENGNFNIAEVLNGINSKLIRRHPHIFGDVHIDDVEGVISNWERLKSEERGTNGKKNNGLLDGVPRSLPALAQSQEYQERVSRVGFDWPDVNGVFAKITEELGEVKTAADNEQLSMELGDLLFVIVRLVSWYNFNAEDVLREANQRFRRRFVYLEALAQKRSRHLEEMSLEEMNELWVIAKKSELMDNS